LSSIVVQMEVPAGDVRPRSHTAVRGFRRREESMAQDHEAELRRALDERLALVNSDPTYEGADPTRNDQLLLAFVGLVIPAVLLVIGWVLYGS
jgi:hypothetical protein